MKHFRLLFLALICMLSAHAQELLSHRYSTKDGLASNTVYNVLSDKRGFLWFATDAGVSQFDGTSFRNFTVKDGLEDNEVLALFEDGDGRIWFYCFNKLPCFYYKGKIYNSRNFSELGKIYNYNWLLLCRRSRETWFAGPKNIYRFRNNKIDLFPLPPAPGLLLLTEIDSLLYVITPTGFFRFDESNQHFVRDDQFPDTKPFYRAVYETGNNNYLVAATNDDKSTDLYKCHIDLKLHQIQMTRWGHFTKQITNCVPDVKRNLILIAFADNTAAEQDLNADTAYPATTYKLRSVPSGTVTDIQGNRWITMLDGGVEMFPANRSRIVGGTEADKGSITCYSLHNMCGTIVAGTNNNSLMFIANGKLTNMKHMSQYSRRDRVLDIKEDKYGRLWIGGDKGVSIYTSSTGAFNYLPMWCNIKDLKYDNNSNKILAASSLGSFTIDCSNGKDIAFINHQRTTAIAGTTGDIWYSTLDNFYNNDGTTTQPLTELNKQLNSRVTCMEKDEQGRLWVGTSANGLFLSDKGKIIKHFKNEDGLTSDICRNLFIDDNSGVWVCTNMGISYITEQNGTYSIVKYNDNNCLADNNVNDVLVVNDTVYVAGTGGVSLFMKKAVSSNYAVPTYITKIKSGAEEMVIDDSLPTVQSKHNTITMFFSGLAYTGNGNVRYEYYLQQVNDKPLTTKNGSVTYSGLAPGTYHFYVRAVDVFGNRSKVPAQLTFTILPAWYQLLWLRILAAILAMAAIISATVFFAKRAEKRKRLKTELQQTISHLELEAIKQQIDPHFIFNCLNAIQGVIYKSDTDTAAYFINRFAKLMRKGLMLSKETFISVEEEYAFIDNYLEVEQLRLNKSFQYRITVDAAINKSNPVVPAFILHPFVENAINHGIKYLKSEQGFIEVNFKKTSKIEIHLIDNGIGMNASKIIKERNGSSHQSKGISLIRDRIASLNKLYNRDIDIHISDRSEGNSNEHGTIVIISFNINKTVQ